MTTGSRRAGRRRAPTAQHLALERPLQEMGGPGRQQGAFIYTGCGKRQAEDAPFEQRLCREQASSLQPAAVHAHSLGSPIRCATCAQACAIQRCLARSNHQEVYCKGDIHAWKDCCVRARALEETQAAASAATASASA